MKLLTASDIFETSIYLADGKKSVLEIALECSVAPQLLILDNNLTSNPQKNQILQIIKRGEIFVLDFDYLDNLTEVDKQKLIEKNKVDYLFIGQILIK